MVSLGIFIVSIVASILLTAWATAAAARAVGSQRAGLRRGLVAVLIIFAINVVLIGVQMKYLTPPPPPADPAAAARGD